MSTKTGKTIEEQIIGVLHFEGPMECNQMTKHISYKYKSISTKCLELEKHGLIERNEDRVWSLRPGVTPQTLETGEIEGVVVKEPGEEVPPILRSKGIPLDQRQSFIERMIALGVSPKEAIPTIADLFFGGDIDNLGWLNHVLLRQAAGYVNHHQRRLMMGWYAQTRGLPYDETEFTWEDDTKGEGKRGGAKGERVEVKPEKRLDPGIGWKIEKDKVGEWVAEPGGPMSYQEAVEAARDRQVITAYAKKEPSGESEGEEVLEEGAPARKGGKRSESLIEYMMKKMVDSMLDGGKGKGDGESETVRQLTERIENMEKERQEERFERMEGMIANIASRDPWEEYDKIEEMKKRLGGGASLVTDQSPAVQLIKDSTEKVDKNINRLVGIIERTALRSEDFTPEKTRSRQERDTKAGELLGEVEGRERSKTLRRETFGM